MNGLPAEWRQLAQTLRCAGCLGEAPAVWELAAEELEKAIQADADELLTLEQAADESGYSADHLGRLVRSGGIPNAGRKNRPLIRRGDVPRKPGAPVRRIKLGATGYDTDGLFRDIVESKYGG